MRIFLDTADTQQIQDGFSTGLIDGVTTNPTLIRKGGRDPEDVYKELIAMGVSDVSCLLYTSPSPRDGLLSRMPSSA